VFAETSAWEDVGELRRAILYVAADPWVVFQIVGAVLSEGQLESVIRRMMYLSMGSLFGRQRRVGIRLMWRLALDLNVQLKLKQIHRPHSEADRLSAVYSASQVERAMPTRMEVADEQSNDAPARAAAAAIEERRARAMLDRQTMAEFGARRELRDGLRAIFVRMLRYGLEWTGQSVAPAADLEEKAAHWLSPGNRDQSLVARILKNLRVLGLETKARAFYVCLSSICAAESSEPQARITAETFRFWSEACCE